MKKLLSLLITALMLLSLASSAFAEEAVIAEEAAPSEEVTIEEATSETSEEPSEKEPAFEVPAGKVFYVSAAAKGSGDGSFEKPFTSIENAQRAVRSMAKTEPITIFVREGEYYFKDTMIFSKDDSGTPNAPVTWKAYNGEKPVFHSTVEIPRKNIEKVEDPMLLERLSSNVRDKLYKMTLPSSLANSMGNVFATNAGAYWHNYDFNMMDVFNDGELMPMSQWPNVGFADVERMSSTEELVNPMFNEEIAKRFSRWTFTDDIVMSYYTKPGYEHFYANVAGFDAKNRTISLTRDSFEEGVNLARLGPAANARVVMMNLIEEIDAPGEWMIDRKNKAIYIYPEGGKVNGKMSVSLLNAPIIRFEEAHDIVFDGLTIGYTRQHGVSIEKNSSNIILRGCEICNVGSSGVYITNSQNCIVEDSMIYNIGSTGVYIENCGAKAHLVESGIIVRNNDIFNIGRLKKCASGAVVPDGSCGVEITNNKMHRIPHQAVWIDGSALVKCNWNEVYGAVRETMDAGALYVNGSLTDWGNEFNYNFIHDITSDLMGRGTTHGTYADAQHHNVAMDNNIFYNVSSGTAFQNGGSFGSIANNIFIKCPTPILFTDYERVYWPTGNRTKSFTAVNADKYLARFPEMQKWLEFDADDAARRKTVGVNLYNNICVGYPMPMPPATSLYEYAKRCDNNIGSKTPADFGFDESKPDYGYDFSYTKDAPIYNEVKDLTLIDFDKIGVDRVTELGATKLIAPENGATGVEGNNAVFSWRGEKGAYRYRLIIAVDENFIGKVFDKVIDETTYTVDTLKYGTRKHYWKVIPVISGKSEKVVDAEPMVYTFTTAKTEEINKTPLRTAVNSIGFAYSNFDYPKEIVAQVDEAKKEAQAILDSKKAKQSNIRAVTKKLTALTTQMYDTTISSVIDVDQFLNNTAGWGGTAPENMEVTKDHATLRTLSQVLGYKGEAVNPGELVKFTLKFNPTGYQSIGICEDTESRLWNTPGYSAVMRLGFIELQRYNYNAEGNIAGGIIAYFPTKNKLVTDMWMMCEFGYSRVHNGTRVVLKVDGTTLIDYVDTTALAVANPGYFRLENGSSEIMTVGTVTNDTTKSGVTNN